ncbi:uncharacterized protein DNG_07404 [Cephalotrichum gorgonifer]|uniref:Uncharacterized protein n=1 Tax=Cephalotrichum gorgonifer TaxID=2041049 RepID=A0AAE8N3C8_9PEZI|nr:uncharacterized protein DNG_07404 [Cephalotrichum gorgonifer]
MSSRFSQMLKGLESKLDAVVNGQSTNNYYSPQAYGSQTYGPQQISHYGSRPYSSQPSYGGPPQHYDASIQYRPPNPPAPAPYGEPVPYGAPHPAQSPFPQLPISSHGPAASYGSAPAPIASPSGPPSHSPPPYDGTPNSYQAPTPYNGAPNALQPPAPYGFPGPQAPSPYGGPTPYPPHPHHSTSPPPLQAATIRSGDSKDSPTTVHASSDPSAPAIYTFTRNSSKPHLVMHYSSPATNNPAAPHLGEAVISMMGTSRLTIRGQSVKVKESGLGDRYTVDTPQGTFKWKRDLAGRITELVDESKNRVAKLKSGPGKKEKTLELCVPCDAQMYEVILLSMVVARTLAKDGDEVVFEVVEAILGV